MSFISTSRCAIRGTSEGIRAPGSVLQKLAHSLHEQTVRLKGGRATDATQADRACRSHFHGMKLSRDRGMGFQGFGHAELSVSSGISILTSRMAAIIHAKPLQVSQIALPFEAVEQPAAMRYTERVCGIFPDSFPAATARRRRRPS